MTPHSDRLFQPSWIEIDTAVIANNCQAIAKHAGANKTLMAVVKANGYGHGAVTVAKTVVANGAQWLAVANFAEAMQLRTHDVTEPILVLTHLPVIAVPLAIEHQIAAVVFDSQQIDAYAHQASHYGGVLSVHLKIDTGMGRLGTLPSDALELTRQIVAAPNLDLQGICTHLSVADTDRTYSQQQLDIFQSTLFSLEKHSIHIPMIHCTNSAGTLWIDDEIVNTVRPGLMLYGVQPTGENLPMLPLSPAMTWKTTVSQIKELPPNHPIGYGNTYITKHAERIAILPVGYADGLRRSPHTWQYVLIHGQRAPLVGRVSMEKVAVRVDHIPNAKMGDEVVLLGQHGNDTITPSEVASWLGTIPYEVLTSILSRVPRI